MAHITLRTEIDQFITAGEAAKASTLLTELWQQNPGPAQAAFVVSRFEQLRPKLNLISSRIAILRSFTVEPLVPVLRAAAMVNGLDLTVQVGDFNAYAQEILDQNSRLYHFRPDILLLAVQTRDVTPNLWHNFTGLSSDQVTNAIRQVVNDFRELVEAFRRGSQAHVILHMLEIPGSPSKGILDAQCETGQIEAIRQINRELIHLAKEYPGVYLLDYDALIARHGRVSWHDERKWLTMRLPIASTCLIHLVNEWLRFIHPLTGKICKALVTDLDNTLWGGVIGEDGMQGLKLGAEYSGAAYRAIQQVMFDLYQRGIILAVCSKNNSAEAMEVIEKHPDMLLGPHHFAALRINWGDKAQNLREIAAELNIGLDAMAFVDDNPVERQWIRDQLPEVTVIDLPDDPIACAQTLRDSPVFERLNVSVEDSQRGRYYAEQRMRSELQQGTASLEKFYYSLQMEVDIAEVTPETIARVAQLTQKTNQFNLTTRRYTEQQIADMAADPAWRVYSARVCDRFGDNGLVGVAITRRQGLLCQIDTFLLSCRVIGRTVETAFLSALTRQAQIEGAQRLVGWFLPTSKNAPARDFYSRHGFSCVEEQNGQSRWEFDLSRAEIAMPDWIKCNILISEGLFQ